VIEALFRGALSREGRGAAHFAAMLMFISCQARKRSNFGNVFLPSIQHEGRDEREAFSRELCQKIGVDASENILKQGRKRSGSCSLSRQAPNPLSSRPDSHPTEFRSALGTLVSKTYRVATNNNQSENNNNHNNDRNPNNSSRPRLPTPNTITKRIGYVDAYDAVLHCDYAFVSLQGNQPAIRRQWAVPHQVVSTAGAVFRAGHDDRSNARSDWCPRPSRGSNGLQLRSSRCSDPRTSSSAFTSRTVSPPEIAMLVATAQVATHGRRSESSVRFPWPA